MSNGHWLLKAFRTISLALALGVSMSACSAGSVKWKEEVQLSDGRVIVVEREKIYEGGGDEWASNRSLSKPKTEFIHITLAAISKQPIEWKTRKMSPQTWPESPLVLDVDAGKLVIFTLVGARVCEMYSKYVYQNGIWVEETLPDQFVQRTSNLLYGPLKDLPDIVNLQEKNKRNNHVYYRKAVKQVGPTHKICSD